MKRPLSVGLAALVGLSAALVPASSEASPRRTSAIVYVSDRDNPPPTNVVDDVYLYDVRTGRTSNVTKDAEAENFPALSPDGRFLAYVVDSTIVVCRLQKVGSDWSCGPRRGIVSYPRADGGNFVWTPDGRSIVYAGTTLDNPDYDVYRVDLDSFAPPTDLTPDPLDAPGTVQVQPDVSPDGRFVVYSEDGDLWRRRIDGSHPVRLTSTPPPVNEFGAEYSPDGRTLAFHSNRRAPNSSPSDLDIYTMAARPESASNVPRNLTSGLTAPDGGPSRERFASFSPDGSRIAFWWSVGGGQLDLDNGEIYTIRADGTDPVNLTDNNGPDPAVPLVGDILPDWGLVRG